MMELTSCSVASKPVHVAAVRFRRKRQNTGAERVGGVFDRPGKRKKKRDTDRRTRPRKCVSIDCGLCRAAFLMERV